MKFESEDRYSEAISTRLTESFKNLLSSPNEGVHAFRELEQILEDAGYTLANEARVTEVLQSNTLVCRSENFSRVVDLLGTGTPIEIRNVHGEANMCNIASGSGFRIAMLEGFSGKDVGGAVKVVIVFSGEHLHDRATIPPEHELWANKPGTAQVSLIGSGTVTPEDVQMISFRFPIRFFPEQFLSESERDLLEDESIDFIVRHYIPEKNTATH